MLAPTLPPLVDLTPEEQRRELLCCAASPSYFINTYCKIYDAVDSGWVPFTLWPEQTRVLNTFRLKQKVIILKARQLGMSWLVLGYALWHVLFRPVASALMFSRRDNEAVHLLDYRLKGMYRRLPRWMQARSVVNDNSHEWVLSNGSAVRAFPTSGGDSYTGTLAIVDEADLIDGLSKLMASVEPTVEMGGQLILLSRPDKSTPNSLFKNIYRTAKAGENDWTPIFLPWFAHPERTSDWHAAQQRESLNNTGSLDTVWEQYPSTDTEALAARTLDKRIPATWLGACYVEAKPLADLPTDAPNLPGLRIYQLPLEDVEYVIGADPAEGNPNSDDSALHVLRADTCEEVAQLAGKYEPAVFASHIDKVGMFFNRAAVLVERNNHGHAVLLWLRDNSSLRRLAGLDKREGWLSNSVGKVWLYDTATDIFKDGATIIHTFKTMTQLGSIEASSLRAPSGEMDDCADSYALTLVGCIARNKGTGAGIVEDW